MNATNSGRDTDPMANTRSGTTTTPTPSTRSWAHSPKKRVSLPLAHYAKALDTRALNVVFSYPRVEKAWRANRSSSSNRPRSPPRSASIGRRSQYRSKSKDPRTPDRSYGKVASAAPSSGAFSPRAQDAGNNVVQEAGDPIRSRPQPLTTTLPQKYLQEFQATQSDVTALTKRQELLEANLYAQRHTLQSAILTAVDTAVAAHTSALTTKFQQALEEERRMREEAEVQAAEMREAEARRQKAIHDKQQHDIDAITAQQAQNTAGLAAILQTLMAMPQVQAQANVAQPPLAHIATHLGPGQHTRSIPPKSTPAQTPPLTKIWKPTHQTNTKPPRRRETNWGTSALADDVPVPTTAKFFKAPVEDAFPIGCT